MKKYLMIGALSLAVVLLMAVSVSACQTANCEGHPWSDVSAHNWDELEGHEWNEGHPWGSVFVKIDLIEGHVWSD